MRESLVPEFDPNLGSALQILGVPGVFIVLILTALAIDSWVSNLRRAYTSAQAVGKVASRGGAWLMQQPPTRAFIVVAATAAVLTVQAFMVLRISFAGGSFIATAFDPDRRSAFDAMFQANTLDPVVIASFTKLDMISAVYMTFSALIIVLSYNKDGRPVPMALILSLPYCAVLAGTLVLVGIIAALDGLNFVLAWLVGQTHDWSATKKHAESYSTIPITLVCGLYCLASFAAVSGSRALRTLWTIR